MAAERFIYILMAIRRSLERLLGAVGLQVASYATPKAFREVAGSLPLGCALLDLCMPDLDGFEPGEGVAGPV
jgi:two-component system response regulator FixJ